MDHAERVEERIDDVDDQQEEARSATAAEEDHGPEAPPRARAVDRRGLEQRFRDRLQPGEEEQEIVADLLPGRGDDDRAAAPGGPLSR
jgi:hypothetical protein